jgi:ATP-dependent Clp protease ATP-binding subunit ClpA
MAKDEHIVPLTLPARRVILLMEGEATIYARPYVEPIHLLVAAVNLRCLANDVLCEHGVRAKEVESQVEFLYSDTVVTTSCMPEDRLLPKWGEDVERVYGFAKDEAVAMNCGFICSGHFLIGLLRMASCVCSKFLVQHGMTEMTTRHMIARRIQWLQNEGPSEQIIKTE